MFSFVNPNFLTKESNFEITPPVKNSNSNVISSFSSLPTFLTNSSIFSILSLKALEVFSIVLSKHREKFFVIVEIIVVDQLVVKLFALELEKFFFFYQ